MNNIHNMIGTPKEFRNEYNHAGYLEKYSDIVKKKTSKWIEPYFYDYWMTIEDKNKFMTYLPIFWTSYYQLDNINVEDRGHSRLKDFMDSNLDKSKKYFTLFQGSSVPFGVLPDNLFMFYAGVNKDIVIPLINPYTDEFRDGSDTAKRDIFCSFIGTIREHNDWNFLRTKMADELDYKYYFRTLYYEETVRYMKRSVFSLCPRGFGPTSYRLFESIAFGSIPIYIWGEEKMIPYQDELDWNDFAVVVEWQDMSSIPSIIESMSKEEIERKRKRLFELYDTHFSMNAVCDYILRKVTL